MKKYDVIYADPPWSYRSKGLKRGGAARHYSTMEIADIINLPVHKLASENSILFLWVTFPMLKEGLETIEKWGFTYKTCAFNWVKKNKISDSWFWGMGNYTRANSEVCLLGIKGKPQRVAKNVHQVITAKVENHSKKPLEVKEKIVSLMGDVPRIELFARDRTPGWDIIAGFDDADGTGQDIINFINNLYGDN